MRGMTNYGKREKERDGNGNVAANAACIY